MLDKFNDGSKLAAQFSKIFNTVNLYEDYNKGTSIGCKGALSSIEFNGYKTEDGYEFYEVINGEVDPNCNIIFDNNAEIISMSNVNIYTYAIEYSYTFNSISTDLSEEDLIRMINEVNSINVAELHKDENYIIFKVNVEYKNEYKNICASGLPYNNINFDKDDIQRWLVSNRLMSYANDFNSTYLKDEINTEINVVDCKLVNINNNLNKSIDNEHRIISNIKCNMCPSNRYGDFSKDVVGKIYICLPDNSTVYVRTNINLVLRRQSLGSAQYYMEFIDLTDVGHSHFCNIYDSNDDENKIGRCNIVTSTVEINSAYDDSVMTNCLLQIGHNFVEQAATEVQVEGFNEEYINVIRSSVRNQLSTIILDFIQQLKN